MTGSERSRHNCEHVRDVREFRRSQLSYSPSTDGHQFQHNYNRDIQLFVIWEGALQKTKTILTDLHEGLIIRSITEIQWSVDMLSKNANRLYKKVHTGSKAVLPKVGGGRLLAVVVEDPDPVYAFDRSVSGLIECVNTNIIRRKKLYRSWFDADYLVHSTNSLGEFFEQAPLVLGPQRMAQSIDALADSLKTKPIEIDTAGAHGWDDFRELFGFLSLATNSIVLRGFERLPDADPAYIEEVDFLCQDLTSFLAASNAEIPNPQRPYKGIIKVGGHRVRVDVRYVGDGYYDAAWERDMLHRQTTHNRVVGRPRPDDYFFSLLYHAKLHKPEISQKYIDVLPSLADSIGLSWVSLSQVVSDDSAAGLLKGYMQANGYRYTKPIDINVGKGTSTLKKMSEVMPERSYLRRRIGTMAHTLLSQLAPGSLKSRIPQDWKTRLAKAMRR